MSAAAPAMPRPAGPKGWTSGGPACLVIAARHLGAAQDAAAFGVDAEGAPHSARLLVAAARRAGLHARSARLSLDELGRLGRRRAAILRFRDGSAMVLVRIDVFEGGTRIILEDPNARQDALLALDTGGS